MLWHPDGHLPLRKKGHGRSIMVSDIISELEGPLKGVDDNGKEIWAREIIFPGKNHDGYWTAEDMAAQFRKAIAIHKRNHPNRIGLWAFDNSSNHNCVAKDALVVSRMNLSPGGKQAVMRDTTVNGIHYTMVFPDDYEDESLRGKPKGMKQVLTDRGLWRNGLQKTCAMCRNDDIDPARVDVTDRDSCHQLLIYQSALWISAPSLDPSPISGSQPHLWISAPSLYLSLSLVRVPPSPSCLGSHLDA